jgi:hypothetical protein
MLAVGCITKSQIPGTVVSSSDSSVMIQLDHQYPQMYTPEMIEKMDAIEKENNVTFLGAYDDTLGGFIFWVNDNTTGKCYSNMIDETQIQNLSCGDGWQVYLEVCKQIKNCDQLI